jgi:HAD superfamily hydrolase (TIGR01509 family)
VVAAVIFDFDGLILDTELPAFRAWTEAYLDAGVQPLTVEEWTGQLGTVGPLDPLAELASRSAAAGTALDPPALAELGERRRLRREQLVAFESVRPGVEDWLAAAAAQGFALGVASSSRREWVVRHLERLGLLDRFGAVRCFGDRRAAAPKPAPDLYLDVCRDLEVAPGDTLAVEDSPNGVLAAKAAGMACVAVPNELTRFLDLDHADLVVASLAQVSLGEALESLGAAGWPVAP